MRIRVICSDFLLFVSTSLGYAFRDFRVVHLTHEQLGACTYCEYRDVCGFDPDIEGYAYRDIGPEDDAVLEEKMASCTGKEDLLDAIHRGSEESD